MSKRRSQHTLEERFQAVLQVIEHHQSSHRVAKDYRISRTTLTAWVRKYEAEGLDGLKESRTWKHYPAELKLNAVQDYLAGQASLRDCCVRYGISETSVLRQWIDQYTSGKALKSTGKGRFTMTKGRNVTQQERIEIAQHCLAENKDYQKMADLYQVSYQQVYQWVRKYLQQGEEGLIDRRGRSLETKASLTDTERLQLRIKELERRNEYLEAENGLIKKLKAIERRRGRPN